MVTDLTEGGVHSHTEGRVLVRVLMYQHFNRHQISIITHKLKCIHSVGALGQ